MFVGSLGILRGIMLLVSVSAYMVRNCLHLALVTKKASPRKSFVANVVFSFLLGYPKAKSMMNGRFSFDSSEQLWGSSMKQSHRSPTCATGNRGVLSMPIEVRDDQCAGGSSAEVSAFRLGVDRGNAGSYGYGSKMDQKIKPPKPPVLFIYFFLHQ